MDEINLQYSNFHYDRYHPCVKGMDGAGEEV